MGVWIETQQLKVSTQLWVSHPSWVCGLKHTEEEIVNLIKSVTPFVGVWIETTPRPWLSLPRRSHPSWVCGLKLWRRWEHRGRKRSHTLRGCVDWNTMKSTPAGILLCHTLRGCVDWNFFCHIITECLKSHTLRGCVDINEWIKCRLIWMKSGLSEFPTDHSMCCFSGKNAEQRGEMLWSWCYYLCGVLCKIYLRYMFRLFQLSDSVPSLAGFVSFSHHIRLLRPSQPSHSAIAFDSFG